MDYVGGYVVVLDMTAKGAGFESMANGMSWTANKVVASFKPIGAFVPAAALPGGDPAALTLDTYVNGELVAEEATSAMKFTIAQQVAAASQLTPLQRGDVLLTGAVSLGDVALGDLVEARIRGLEGNYTVSATLVAAAARASL